MIQGRRVSRPVVARGDLVEERSRLLMAGQDMVRGDKVIVVAVGQRTDECGPVHAGRESRQMLADLDAWHFCRDWLEVAAHLEGSIRLEVEHVEMAGRAGEEDDDDRFRLLRFR